MMRLLLVITFSTLATAASAANEIPEPAELAFDLSEDDFEDYLDAWLENEYLKINNSASSAVPSGCTINILSDLGQPQPVYISNRNYLQPYGNTGRIVLNTGQQVTIACTGPNRQIVHPNLNSNLALGTVSCVYNNLVQARFLRGDSAFGGLTCSNYSVHEAQGTLTRCWNNNMVIRVGFIVQGIFYPLYWSCFDRRRLEVIYVWYPQTPVNYIHQTGVARPSFLPGTFYPGVDINNLYAKIQQTQRIIQLTGKDTYVNSTKYLTRGHLAAKTDFVFATGQQASFYYINAAPQWNPINAGNWNRLEQSLRARIAAAGYQTTIYTGTFGVTQLRNINNEFVNIYLHTNNQLPVPMYFYKVVYDASRRLGTAFVTINNPYYTLNEARALKFCIDQCRTNAAFNWIGWYPDHVNIGYSFCCNIDEFRKKIPHLPAFTVSGLLT